MYLHINYLNKEEEITPIIDLLLKSGLKYNKITHFGLTLHYGLPTGLVYRPTKDFQ